MGHDVVTRLHRLLRATKNELKMGGNRDELVKKIVKLQRLLTSQQHMIHNKMIHIDHALDHHDIHHHLREAIHDHLDELEERHLRRAVEHEEGYEKAQTDNHIFSHHLGGDSKLTSLDKHDHDADIEHALSHVSMSSSSSSHLDEHLMKHYGVSTRSLLSDGIDKALDDELNHNTWNHRMEKHFGRKK